MNQSKLFSTRASRAALLGSTAALALVVGAGSALADTVETVVVTGSHIPQTALDAAGPVTVVNSEAIAKTSTSSVDQLLQKLPTVASGQIGESTNNPTGGDAFIDLRGLGANRTLVLIDGKRTINGGSGGASSAVDLTSIPVAMIDRIEVYQDGASAVYGSDAIAGVVNVILKSDFNGIEASAQVGQTSHRDGTTSNLSAIMGMSGDKGHVILGLEFENRAGILQGDRAFSHAVFKELSPGVLTPSGSASQIGGRAYTYTPGVPASADLPIPSCGGATYVTWQTGVCTADPGASARFNFGARSYLTEPLQRTTLTTSGEYEITPDITAFVEGYFTNRSSHSQLAPDPSSPLYIPATNPYNTTGFDLVMTRRPIENGNRVYSQSVQTFRANVGLKGSLDFIPDGTWEVDGIFGRVSSLATTHSLNLMTHYATALDPVACAADALCSEAAAATGQAAVNVFGPSTILPGWLPYLTAETHDIGGNTMNMFSGNITGTIVDLPAGKLAFAAGGEFRQEAGFSTPDYLNSTGQTDQSGLPTAGGYKSYEVYGELNVPLVADAPWAEKLELDLAGRLGEFDASGPHKQAPTFKVGLSWQPIDDIRFRANYSGATRFPSIGELFGGSYSGYDFAADPCKAGGLKTTNATVNTNCTAQGVPAGFTGDPSDQILTLHESNPGLNPERAIDVTLGAVFTPTFLPGFSATIDYWDDKIYGYIGQIDTQTEVNACYESVGLTSPYCANFFRNGTHHITDNTLQTRNLTYIKTDGLDLAATYTTDDVFGGSLTIAPAVTWLDKYDQETDPVAGQTSYAGTIEQYGSFTHWRGNLNVGFSMEDWGVSVTERWIGPAVDPGAPSGNKYTRVPSIYYTNLEGHFDLNSNWTLAAGVDNVFDQQPPFFDDYADENTDPGTYDTKGTFMWVRVTTKL